MEGCGRAHGAESLGSVPLSVSETPSSMDHSSSWFTANRSGLANSDPVCPARRLGCRLGSNSALAARNMEQEDRVLPRTRRVGRVAEARELRRESRVTGNAGSRRGASRSRNSRVAEIWKLVLVVKRLIDTVKQQSFCFCFVVPVLIPKYDFILKILQFCSKYSTVMLLKAKYIL
jgi:hypothetical protein